MRDGRVKHLASGARARGQEIARNAARLDVPWARCDFARMLRELILSAGWGTVMGIYLRRRAVGREALDGIEPPVIFVANHNSHVDTPLILKMLPPRWRQRVAVAAAADYFYTKRWFAYAVSLMFNTVPMSRNGGGMSEDATRHVDRLLAERWSLLVYPEGTRSRDGRVGKLRSGAAVLAAEHGIPIVPIYVEGTRAVMPKGRSWPKFRPFRRRHRVTLTFGEPIWPREGEHRTELMERVREFFVAQGAETTPGKVAKRREPEPEPLSPAA